MNYFKEACRSKRGRAIQNIELEPNLNQGEEVYIGKANTNSVSCNSQHSIITGNFKTFSNQSRITVLYEVDIHCNGKIMPLHIYKK